MKLDRFGNQRNDGYETDDYVLCEKCAPSGRIDEAQLDPQFRFCGGYGEYPKARRSKPAPDKR